MNENFGVFDVFVCIMIDRSVEKRVKQAENLNFDRFAAPIKSKSLYLLQLLINTSDKQLVYLKEFGIFVL